MYLKIKKLTGRLPERKFRSSGYDLFTTEELTIWPRDTVKLPLGFATEFEDGYLALITDRSGNALSGLQVQAGVVDPDYRWEWAVVLYNAGRLPRIIKPDVAIAQVLFLKCEVPVVEEVTDLGPSDRGTRGFGSTGVV